ncbi:MAG TPA: 5-oxoprolinase subunit PxpB [Candidatus Eisenbacteria bacterium]|nr:5-oxoprolinase subunit PxpB [Candidatus Eisenbacteria bacterium]
MASGGAEPAARAGFAFRVEAFGDRGVLISISDHADVRSAARAHALAAAIERESGGRPGWRTPVSTATSVLLPVDPVEPGVDVALEDVQGWLARLPTPEIDERWSTEPAPLEIPVRYGGSDGPDLATVAELTGLTAAQVIELHAATPLRVLFLGFAPGFGYLGPLPPALLVPRRAAPRTRVPAGSVAIAGPHTAVYPVDSPGGWHLLGRTSMTLWDPLRTPPATLRPGDRVRFIPERPA